MEQTRRQVMVKGLAGVGVGGVVWTAPRVIGLSVRPDFAAAQSTSPSTTLPGAVFDVSTFRSYFSIDYSGLSGSADALAPGLDHVRIFTRRGGGASSPVYSYVRADVRGSLVGVTCDLAGIDTVNGGPYVGVDLSVTSRQRLHQDVDQRPGSSTVHIVCT